MTLYESSQEKITLKEDVDNVMNYIELEKLRQGNNAVIETDIHYGTGDQLIAPLLFLPLVENAFKHGVNNKIRDAFFRFSVTGEQGKVSAEVINSKSRAPLDADQEHAGIGLHNFRRRLELFYPGKHSLEIQETEGNYIARLTITT